jgi:penicillin-binding protein 1A
MGIFSGRRKAKGNTRREPRLFQGQDYRRHPQRGARPKRRGFFRWIAGLFWKLTLLGAVTAAAALAFVWFTLAQNEVFQIPEREPGILLLASDGSEIAEQGTFFGDAVSTAGLPPYVPQAIIAIEDRRFYHHYGVDPIGLARAMTKNVIAGRLKEGGSTLTQQLAKNLFLSHERTLKRKAQEMVFALWLERKFSKDEILQLYMNRVYFGGGADGIDKAARTFYGKSAYELTLMEAATLAGVLKAPTTYNPARQPEDAFNRATIVLNAMVEEGYITAAEAQDAIASPTRAATQVDTPATQYAVDWINEQLRLLTKETKQSLIIETTLDAKLQSRAEQALRKRLAENGKALNVTQGAVVVMDGTGAVKALVGGRSYKRSQYNRAVVAKRQPGSSFKAFVYLAALENGYRPDSVEIDEPVQIGNWSPENYKRKYLGPVTLDQAYALSLNTISAKLTHAVNPRTVATVAKRLGIRSKLSADTSIALGTSEVSLMEMTSAFTPFSNGGSAVEPYIVKRIVSRDGRVLYERLADGLGQVMGEDEVGAMNYMMHKVITSGTATKASFEGQDMGGKTGTSQDYRDAWFIGYTPYLTAGVWMGNDDNSPTKKVTGGSLPALVWRDIMEKAHENLAYRELPGTSGGPSEFVVAQNDASGVIEVDPDIAEPQEKPRKKKRRNLLSILFGSRDEEPDDGLY